MATSHGTSTNILRIGVTVVDAIDNSGIEDATVHVSAWDTTAALYSHEGATNSGGVYSHDFSFGADVPSPYLIIEVTTSDYLPYSRIIKSSSEWEDEGGTRQFFSQEDYWLYHCVFLVKLMPAWALNPLHSRET